MLLVNPLHAASRRHLQDHLAALARAFAHLEDALGDSHPTADSRRAGMHADIRYDPRAFLDKVRWAAVLSAALGARAPTRFLDIGCGAGGKVLLASAFFDRAEGLERDAHALAAARAVLNRSPAGVSPVLAGDALTFRHYRRYDVLYLFRPFSDDARQRQLEERVARLARPGAVILGPLCGFAALAPAFGLCSAGDKVWVKGVDPAALRAARRTAARADLPAHVPLDPDRQAIWADLCRERQRPVRLLSRAEWEEAVTPERLGAAIEALRRQAPRAADVLALRVLGRASLPDIVRLERQPLAEVRRNWRLGLRALAARLGDSR
jgi:SAM-dependent methyltransferase